MSDMRYQGKLVPLSTFLEKLFDMLDRLDHEASLRLIDRHRVGEIGGYWNDYKSDGVTNASR